MPPTPAGLWAGTKDRGGRGPAGPQGRGGHPGWRQPLPRGLPDIKDPDLGPVESKCASVGHQDTLSCRPTPSLPVWHHLLPCSPPFGSTMGSQPLILQMCCAQLFARRLSFLPLLLTGPPHPAPALYDTLCQNADSRGPRSVCPHKALAHVHSGQLQGLLSLSQATCP